MKFQSFPLNYVDLHVHTNCSDGTLSPEEVVKEAFDKNIGVIAITDHDNVSGIARAKEEAKKYDIKVIPGIECSTACDTGTLHILGYNIDYNNALIKRFISKCQDNRRDRIIKIIHKLNELGFNISVNEVETIANNGTIGRPHIARAMLEKGYVSSIKDSFEKYLKKGRPAYVPKINPSIEEVISTIKSAGGIPVLAHPLQMNCGSLEDTLLEIERLVSLGIEGIECIYPNHGVGVDFAFVSLANKLNVYVTCGSDFHGENKSIKLGNCFFNEKKVSIKGLDGLGKSFV